MEALWFWKPVPLGLACSSHVIPTSFEKEDMLYNGEVSGLVKALELELRYYKNAVKEQEAVIKQLHRGYALPGEVTYIHPYDFAEMINKLETIVTNIYSVNSLSDLGIVSVEGQRFKQSPYMPQITKNIR